MRDFVAIDFETGNARRVSACEIGFARVVGGEIVESDAYLMRPVGGHAPLQSRIHGIRDEHTCDKPDFAALFPTLRARIGTNLVAHSGFDQQVLAALLDHHGLDLSFSYTDTCKLARMRVPALANHKLKTLAKHFQLPKFQHHDARADAVACASIYLRLDSDVQADGPPRGTDPASSRGQILAMLAEIVSDEEVSYKEAFQLLYWLQDNHAARLLVPRLYRALSATLEDATLERLESVFLKYVMRSTIEEIRELEKFS